MMRNTSFQVLLLPLLFIGLLYCQESGAERVESILYIGDSISYGQFGRSVDSVLRSLSVNVATMAACGSSPSSWLTHLGPIQFAKTNCGFWQKNRTSEVRAKVHLIPKLESAIHFLRPFVTIIQLGTNIAASEHPELQAESVSQMLKVIFASGSQCVWIGPPAANSKVVSIEKLARTNLMLSHLTQSGNCAYIDTLSFTQAPSGPGDGIHPGPALARQWADKVILRLKPLLKKSSDS